METIDKSESTNQDLSPKTAALVTSADAAGARSEPPAAGGQTEAAAPILYDADKQQRIPFLIENDGEQVEVAFVLDAQTDAALIAYEKLLDRRMFQADRQQTGQRDAMESTDNSLEASIWLFKDRAIDADGFGEVGETLADGWKTDAEFMEDAERADVIDKAYLAAQVVPLPIAKPGKRLPMKRTQTLPSTIRVKALYEGNELILSHQMAKAGADEISTFKSIQKERWIVQGTHLNQGEIRIPAKFQKLGAIYKKLAQATTGYAGRVPLHHQAIVVLDHLSREVEAVRKN